MTQLNAATLLAAYDAQLRTEVEVGSALAVTQLGPLWLARFSGGRGFITYRSLAGESLKDLVPEALSHFSADESIATVEWKTRGHDVAPGLPEALLQAGFVEQEPESIMIGEAASLALELPLPAGVELRRVLDEADIRATCAMQDEVFGEPPSDARADDLVVRLAHNPDNQLWAASTGGQIVSAGYLAPDAGTQFAGIWGGATRPQWRGKGIYRALTAARANSAIQAGATLIRSDSTEYSRPILERSGLVKVSTTTPWEWTRPTV